MRRCYFALRHALVRAQALSWLLALGRGGLRPVWGGRLFGRREPLAEPLDEPLECSGVRRDVSRGFRREPLFGRGLRPLVHWALREMPT